MTNKYLSVIACSLLALAIAPGAVAQEQSVEEFYSNNDLTLVVGAAAGGGADFYARQFVPFWQKHIPGNPDIIVRNLPGASGMSAAIQMMSAAPKDGTEVAMLLRNNLYFPLVSDVPLDFEPLEANWLGSLTKEIYTVAIMTRAGIESADDLFDTTIRMGATSFANENRVLPAMMNEYLGTQFEIITGYEGAAAMTLALERGEIDGRMLPVDNLIGYGNEAPFLEDGTIEVVLQTAVNSSEHFPDAPNLFDYIEDPEIEALARFVLAPMEAGRPFAAPAGIPEDRLAALRQAFMDATADPEYIAHMEQVANTPTPISGEAVQEIVEEIYSASDDVLEKVRPLVNPQS
jgi:tripartite-type tricarboxylate transporter receptor subunit TctC|tara:strand:- start:49474 stop:50514 length:1041 start_codon:yes stop_codon:yes gene_type:complete